MGLKGQITRATFLEWDSMLVLLQKLERDGEYKFLLLIATGCFVALRISDLLQLRWIDVLDQDQLVITEGKTRKVRRIAINPKLASVISRMHSKMDIVDNNQYLFLNRFGTKPINVQYVNRKLKEIAKKYKLNIPLSGTSSHMFRKTLGRHVWAMNNYSEKSLLLLGELFNHSSIKITKTYLAIKEQEIGDVYLNL